MSDTPERRYEDARMDKLEETMEGIQKIVEKIRVKIFNGFDKSIKSTENKVDYIDQRNQSEHKGLKDDIKELSKKFDKIMWMFGVGAFGFVVFQVVRSLL